VKTDERETVVEKRVIGTRTDADGYVTSVDVEGDPLSPVSARDVLTDMEMGMCEYYVQEGEMR